MTQAPLEPGNAVPIVPLQNQPDSNPVSVPAGSIHDPAKLHGQQPADSRVGPAAAPRSLERIKLITDIATAWIGVVALSVGALFAGFQYLEKDRADKVKETLNFVERYAKPPFSEAHTKVIETWIKHQADIDDALAANDDRFNTKMLDIIRAERLQASIYTLIDFFDALEVCVAHDICEVKVALQFFGQEARAVFNQNYALIEHERKRRNDPTFAQGLQRFAGRLTPTL